MSKVANDLLEGIKEASIIKHALEDNGCYKAAEQLGSLLNKVRQDLNKQHDIDIHWNISIYKCESAANEDK